MELFLAGFASLGVFMLFAGMARMASGTATVQTVANQYTRPKTLEEIQMSQPFTQRALWPALRSLGQFLARLSPQKLPEMTRRKLDLAGNPFDLPVVEFIGLRYLSAALGALLAALGFFYLQANPLAIVLFLVIGAALGFYLPLLWLNSRIRARQEDILTSLADALDLLTVCAEAGMGLDSAMGQVAEKWQNNLSRAFGRALNELRLGKARHQVLRDMAERAEVRELTNFVAALVQAEQAGAPIARILRVQSEQMRVLRRQRAQERANQMPIRLLFPLILFIFPSIFVVLLGPAVIRLMSGFLTK